MEVENNCCSIVNCIWGGSLDNQISGVLLHRSKIGFATIATGPFVSFAIDLWTSIKRHAFLRHEIHFFVFTDNEAAFSGENVHTRYFKRIGWPFDSLGRPFIFGNASDWFKEMDYMYSIDADMLVVNSIDDSALGDRVGALQAWFAVEKRSDFTYESRLTPAGTPYSSAYISSDEGICYYAGGLYGGTLSGFQSITSAIISLARKDLEENPRHAALWEDESYINKVFLENAPTVVLGPAYVYPEPPFDEWFKTRLNLFKADVIPRIYNLGVRKHGEVGGLDRHHLTKGRVATLPAFMSPTNFEENYPMFSEIVSVLDEVTIVLRAYIWPRCLPKQITAVTNSPFTQMAILYDSPNSFANQWNSYHILEKLRISVFETDHKTVNRLKNRANGEKNSINLLNEKIVHAPLKILGDKLLTTVMTPYILFIDDDVVGSLPQGSQHLIAVLEFSNIDIAGGCIDNISSAGYTGEQGNLIPSVYCKGTPPLKPADYATPDIACWRVDFISGFYAARTDVVRRLNWGKSLTGIMNDDFFIRASLAGVRVALCRGVSAPTVSCEGVSTVHIDNGNRFRHSSSGLLVPIQPLIPQRWNDWQSQSYIVSWLFLTGLLVVLFFSRFYLLRANYNIFHLKLQKSR